MDEGFVEVENKGFTGSIVVMVSNGRRKGRGKERKKGRE